MKKLCLFFRMQAFSLYVIVLLVAGGCRSGTFDGAGFEEMAGAYHNMKPACGIMQNGSTLFNVTGFILSPVIPNSTIYLFVTSDTSFQTSLDTVANHPYIFKGPIINQINFSFSGLPPGDYVAMVQRSSFPGNVQGYPIAHEFNCSNHSVKINFHGGNGKYSLLSFSIRPSLEGAKTEK